MLRTDTKIESKTRDRAYAIWEAEGRPEGRAADHWLAAETESRPAAKAKARGVRRTSKGNGVPAARSARSSATAGKKKTPPNGR